LKPTLVETDLDQFPRLDPQARAWPSGLNDQASIPLHEVAQVRTLWVAMFEPSMDLD